MRSRGQVCPLDVLSRGRGAVGTLLPQNQKPGPGEGPLRTWDLLAPGPCAGPGCSGGRQGAVPFRGLPHLTQDSPGLRPAPGVPVGAFSGKKAIGAERAASAFRRSRSAAPAPAWLPAPGHCGSTKRTHTTIPGQSPLSPFFFIIVIITFQTLQLLGLVIAGEAFGQSSWGPLLLCTSPSQAQRHCWLFDKIHKTDTDRLTYMTSLNFNPFSLSRRGGPASVEVPVHCSPSKPS